MRPRRSQGSSRIRFVLSVSITLTPKNSRAVCGNVNPAILTARLILEHHMNTNTPRASAIPSLFKLKGEVQATRDQAKASGKKMSNSGAMKEVARKYGFRNWEALQNAAAKNVQVDAANSVTFLLVNEADQVLIVNRTIIGSSESSMGDSSIEGIAEGLANVLNVDLVRVSYATSEAIDGEEWTFAKIAAKLDLIDPVSQTEVPGTPSFLGDGYKLHHALANGNDIFVGDVHGSPLANTKFYDDFRGLFGEPPVKPNTPRSFEKVLELGQTLTEYIHRYAPYIDFHKVVASVPHPDPVQGEIDYTVSITLEVTDGEPIGGYYTCNVSTEKNGQLDKLPPAEFVEKCKSAAMDILHRLVSKGIDLDPGKFADQSTQDQFDPATDL
jgi:hypothetical protein